MKVIYKRGTDMGTQEVYLWVDTHGIVAFDTSDMTSWYSIRDEADALDALSKNKFGEYIENKVPNVHKLTLWEDLAQQFRNEKINKILNG